MTEARERGAPPVDSERIICYGKTTENGDTAIATAVNLDPQHAPEIARTGEKLVHLVRRVRVDAERTEVELPPARLERNYVSLDPQHAPAHIVSLRRRVRGERDFDHFL